MPWLFEACTGKTTSNGEPEDRGELFWMLIDIHQARKNNSLLNLRGDLVHVFCDTLLNIPERHFKGTPELKNILQQLLKFHDLKTLDPLDDLRINYLITGFLLEVIAVSKMPQYPVKNDSLIKILNFIEDNLEANFSIALLADLVNLSESRFKSWFKLQTGLPPLEFTTRKKIIYAKSLLKKKDYTILDISYKLSFSSPQYFSRVFKKYTGSLPSENR